MTTTTTKRADILAFPCTCNGCTGYRADYDRASLEAVVEEIGRTGSSYFSPSTRRWHKSRPTGWVTVSGGCVIVKSTEEGPAIGSRVKRLTLFCPYGSVIEAAHYTTANQVRKALFNFYGDTVCTCHGCRIDRISA